MSKKIYRVRCHQRFTLTVDIEARDEEEALLACYEKGIWTSPPVERSEPEWEWVEAAAEVETVLAEEEP